MLVILDAHNCIIYLFTHEQSHRALAVKADAMPGRRNHEFIWLKPIKVYSVLALDFSTVNAQKTVGKVTPIVCKMNKPRFKD